MLLRPLPAAFVRHVVYPVYRGFRADRVLEMLDGLEHAERRARRVEDRQIHGTRRRVIDARGHQLALRDRQGDLVTGDEDLGGHLVPVEWPVGRAV